MDTYDDQMNNGEESRQKPSPFADAPYVSPFTVESPMEEAAPPETPKTRKKVWPRVAAGAMALVLAAGLCGGTAAVMNGRWENRMDNAVKSFDQQIAALEKELEAVRRSTIFLPGNAVNTGNGGMSPTQVYEMCKRSVVAVTSEVSYGLNVGKSSGSASSSLKMAILFPTTMWWRARAA